MSRLVAAVALLAVLLPLAPRVEWVEVVQTRMRRFDHALSVAEPYTSPPIWLGLDATSIGAHWVRTPGSSAAVAVRTSEDGLAWSDWHDLEGEATQPHGDAERVLGVLAAGLTGRVAQYRVEPGISLQRDTRRGEPDGPARRAPSDVGEAHGAVIHSLTLFALDSSQSRLEPRPVLGPQTASATIKPLDIVGRRQWGADESIRFERGTEKIWPEEVARVEKIVVHHTAGPNVCASPEPWCQRRAVIAINDIYHFHTVGNGWGDIGYNSIVGYDGRIYEGRHGPEPLGTTEPLEQPVVGAHALGYNARSHGISLMGNFELEPVPDLQWDALSRMVGWVVRSQLAAAPLDPTGAADFRGAGERLKPSLPTIAGHRDVAEGYQTECPGEHLYARLEDLRHQVRRLVEWPPLRVELRARPLPDGAVAYHVLVDNHEPELVKWLTIKGAVPENADFVDSWAGAPTQNRGTWDGSTVTWHAPEEALEPGRERREHVFVLRPKPGVAPVAVRAVAWAEFAEPARGVAMSERVAADAPVDLVADPAVAGRVATDGPWTASRNVATYYGDGYHVAEPGSGGTFTWEADLPRAGTYELLAWWPAAADRATDAPYTVQGRTIRVNQRERGSRWISLGRFDFEAGPARLTLATTPTGVVIADAVRFRQVR